MRQAPPLAICVRIHLLTYILCASECVRDCSTHVECVSERVVCSTTICIVIGRNGTLAIGTNPSNLTPHVHIHSRHTRERATQSAPHVFKHLRNLCTMSHKHKHTNNLMHINKRMFRTQNNRIRASRDLFRYAATCAQHFDMTMCSHVCTRQISPERICIFLSLSRLPERIAAAEPAPTGARALSLIIYICNFQRA